MKTYLECIPCFFKQGIESAKILGADEKTQKQIIDGIAAIIPSFSLSLSPPEMGKIVHDIVKKKLKMDDPYKELKHKSNRLALSIYDKLKQKVCDSSDRLLTCVELSIAGNIIDYGANHGVNPEKEVLKILQKESAMLNGNHFQYDLFKRTLHNARRILFIGDNAGEIVFDRIFLEEVKAMYPSLQPVYAVREKPIINDVTIEDAHSVGMDKIADIVSSGSLIPGTLLSQSKKEFVDLFKSADLIISKGQGNYETLSDCKGSFPLFFLLTVKCAVVGSGLDAGIGDIILKSKRSN